MTWLAKGAIALTVVLMAGVGPGASIGLAQMSPDQISRAIADTYGVEVLRVDEVETENGTVYQVVVMNPGGNFNEAFQVNRLRVDPATGQLISQFDNGPNGAVVGADRNLKEDSGVTLRRNSF